VAEGTTILAEPAHNTKEAKKMEPSSGRKQTVAYTGIGIALGAGLGVLFGMLLLDSLPLGLTMGVVAGLLVGAVVDMQRRKSGGG
jgi:uncharacterized membrane protein